MVKNKKASSELISPSLFLILNLVFIVLLLIFVNNSSKGAFVYEEMYAKQIALLIDNAEPGTTVFIDFSKALDIANSNNKKTESIVKLDNEKNEVTVSLSNRGGHSFRYFSDYKVTSYIGNNKLGIVIEK